LKFLSTCVNNNGRIARWFAFLQEFDLEIVHIPGRENEIADTLSRNGQNGDKSIEEKRIAMIRDDKEGIDTSGWTEIIKKAQKEDDSLQEAVRGQRTRARRLTTNKISGWR